MAASSSSALIPSSSSSLGSSSKYQVFLSFTGEDTRKGFTCHLYKALKDAGIDAFMDDEEIEVGEKFSERILKAIEESRYYVVILSQGYADSKWCLRELVAMESVAMSPQHEKVIIPVFYYVEPSDVRHQRNTFENAFKKHEVLYDPTDVKEWRQAMTKVGERQGHVINHESNKKEVELIQEIVEGIGVT
ncbi:Toll/interleukin-1 receptor-like protein [Nymphaea thermarum]|nr:Toll/interleukin-1 receptor-like protein [Nymphaea thermarum]